MKEVDLTNAADCRWYCENFEIPGKGRAEHVTLSSGRQIEFKTMSDADAIMVANQLYEMELEAAALGKKEVLDDGRDLH